MQNCTRLPKSSPPHYYNTAKENMNEQIEVLLSKLDKVEKLTPGQHAARYRACCPAHDDKDPSLSITETLNGTILLKCWSGCSAHEIVSAVGMTMSDLFPKEHTHHSPPVKRAFSAEQAAKMVAQDALLTMMVLAKVRSGDKLSQKDMDDITDAHARCHTIARAM